MAIKLFLMYMGGFLGVSIALLAMVKQFAADIAEYGKKPVLYGVLLALCTGILSFGATYASSDLFLVFWLMAAIFLVSGMVYMGVMHSKFFKLKEDSDKSKVFIGELMYMLAIIFVTIVVFACMQYFLRDRFYLFYPVLFSIIMFAVPFLVSNTFNAAYNIPAAYYTTWQYPVNNPIDPPDDNGNERLVVIGFEIGKKISDQHKTFFRAKAPEEIQLGELFYHFINDYNELQSETPIQYINAENEPVEWWFRIKTKWYQRNRILDPGLAIKHNKISENSVIICERI